MTTSSKRTTIFLLSVCLVISFCLNLFAGGAWFAGRWLDRRLQASAGEVMRAYPPALRRDVVERLLDDRRALRTAIVALRAARQHMFVLMQAEEIDRAALDSALAEVRDNTSLLQALLQTALAESLEDAPLAERQRISPPGAGFGLFGEAVP